MLAVAAWRLASGGGGDPEVYLAATRHAHAMVDPALIERLTQAALAAGAPRFEVGLALGEALAWQGKLDEADGQLAALSGLAGTDAERASLALARAVPLFWGRGRPGEAEAVLHEAEMAIENVDLHHELMAFRAGVCLVSGRSPEALRAALGVVEATESSPANLVRALMAVLPAMALCGHVEKALGHEPRVLPALEASGEAVAEGRARLLSALVLVHQLAGNLGQAVTLAKRVYADALARRGLWATPMAAMMLGTTALAAGHMAEATPWLREAVTQLRRRDVNGFLPWCLAGLAQAVACSGDAAEAVTLMAEADAALGPAASMFAPGVSRARAWVAAAGGEVSRARLLALEAADVAAGAGQRAIELAALHDALRLGARGDLMARIEHVGTMVEGELAATYVAHGRALMAGDGRALDEVAAAFGAMGAELLSAEAAVEASASHTDAGLVARGRASMARAAVLAEACGHPHTPVLDTSLEAEGLSRREREVAALAAKGWSNRHIAGVLVVSTRTVEGHLARAFAKLGVGHRDELGSVLGLDMHDEPTSSRPYRPRA